MSKKIQFAIKEDMRPKIELILAKKGWTKLEFSKYIHLNRSYIGQIISGQRHCSAYAALKICNGLGIEVNDYFDCSSIPA